MCKAVKHAKLDQGVVKQAQECNKHQEGEDCKAIGCKMENMKALEKALKEKREDAEKAKKQADSDLKKVKVDMEKLAGKQSEAKARQKKEDKEHEEAVDKAVQSRMKELEGCERAKIQSEMEAKRDCQRKEKNKRLEEAKEKLCNAKKSSC